MSNDKSLPTFAVIGHPNKGKSSVIAALVQDDSIAISPLPGTTKRAQEYRFRIDGRDIFALIDTPGFQRPEETLAWLKKVDTPAHLRPDRLREFVFLHRDNPRFSDETELLKPLLSGAAFLYVVDSSKPYMSMYESQLEILRYSGAPSMAVLNPIGKEDYSSEWLSVLNQYVQHVRIFDPMRRDYMQSAALLEAMAQLRAQWTIPLKQALEAYRRNETARINESIASIFEAVDEIVSLKMTYTVKKDEASDRIRKIALGRYRAKLGRIEARMHREIEAIWRHERLRTRIPSFRLEGIDLFSKESYELFGMDRSEVLKAGAGAGALTGAGIDMLLAGHTVLLGALVGGLVGGASAYWGFGKLADIAFLGEPLGKRRVRIGPLKDPAVAVMILRRALAVVWEVATFSHAKAALEDRIEVADTLSFSELSDQKLYRFVQKSFLKNDQKARTQLYRAIESALIRHLGIET